MENLLAILKYKLILQLLTNNIVEMADHSAVQFYWSLVNFRFWQIDHKALSAV
jgi:hypothetical protein